MGTVAFNTSKFKQVFALLTALFMAGVVIVLTPSPAMAAPVQKSIIVSPHPDDETHAWSLMEGSTANYKVLVFLTKGEQTIRCQNSGYEANTGEVRPLHLNPGKWTKECTDSRINSTLRFFNAMSAKDSSIPGGFSLNRVRTVHPNSQGKRLGHEDAGDYFNPNSSAQVYDGNDMGKIIFFNLGDGDLTTEEVTWALYSLQNEPWVYGLPNLRTINMIGAFRNRSYPNCFVYGNADHTSVHQALWNTDFGDGWQAAATCAADPDVKRTGTVSDAQWNNLVKVRSDGYREGILQKEYGWLDPGPWETSSQYDQKQQEWVFHQKQRYWTRH